MSDNITNGEILRAIDKLDKRLDNLTNQLSEMQSKLDRFKYWVIGVIISIILGASFTAIGVLI